MSDAKTNTDREIWRERPGDYYADSIFVTADGRGVGINCGGAVVVMPLREWHSLALDAVAVEMSAPITFEVFQRLSARRCSEAFPTCKNWSLNDWAVALAGEVGELCNILKKIRRGDHGAAYSADVRQSVLSELADVIIYADMLMTQVGADTGAEVMRKFDEVSARVGWKPGAVDPHADSNTGTPTTRVANFSSDLTPQGVQQDEQEP